MLLAKYAKTASMTTAAVGGEGYLFLADYVLRLVRVAVLLGIWRTVLGARGEALGMTLGAVLTYTFVAHVFGEQLGPRSGITNAMWDGSFAAHFGRPMNVVGQFAAEMVGRWLPDLAFFALPLLLCAPLFGVDPRPADVLHGALFVVSIVLGVSVALALDFIQGALTVQTDMGPWVFDRLRSAISSVVSGGLVPLALLPWGLGVVFQWLPFAAMVSAPLRIYTATGPVLSLLAGQLAWSLALWPLARWLWVANRERLSTYGG